MEELERQAEAEMRRAGALGNPSAGRWTPPPASAGSAGATAFGGGDEEYGRVDSDDDGPPWTAEDESRAITDLAMQQFAERGVRVSPSTRAGSSYGAPGSSPEEMRSHALAQVLQRQQRLAQERPVSARPEITVGARARAAPILTAAPMVSVAARPAGVPRDSGARKEAMPMQTIPDSDFEAEQAAKAAQAAQAEAEGGRVMARRGVTRRTGRGGRPDGGGRSGEVEGGLGGMRSRLRERRGLDPDGDAGSRAGGGAGAGAAAADAAGAPRRSRTSLTSRAAGNGDVAAAGHANGDSGVARDLDPADALSAASHGTLSAIAVLLASMEALPSPRSGDEDQDQLYREVTQHMTRLSALLERYLGGLPTE
jgi:hypothetical protein